MVIAVVTLQGFVLGKLDLLTVLRETQICKCDRFFPKGKFYRLGLENRKKTKECPVDFA